MEPPRRLTLNYSLKNIPIPSQTSYMKRLIEKTESVMRRMRWRAYHYLRGKDEDRLPTEKHFGLHSRKSPPHVEELKAFEEDLAKLIENVTFRNVFHDSFQKTLRHDITHIKRSEAIFVSADKTRNLYELKKEQYEKLLKENTTKHYRSADERAYHDINSEAQAIANGLGIAGMMDIMAKRTAYITLKDHKENFDNKLPCRLINPAKSELGIVSKRILDNINSRLREQLDVTMWKNSASVIEWFQSIEDKHNCSFICFDIIEFYPSISERLLTKALDFAQRHTDITDEEINVIHHARKSLLFSEDGTAWMKKDGLFDVAMGSHDGAEVCEMVGIYALAQLPPRYRTGNVGLYRDDGLGVFQGIRGNEAERAKKDITKRFKDLGLRITIEANLKVTNFLDLTLNLNNGKYYPFRKPNDRPLYIHKRSNHPPAILKHLPDAISRRLTDTAYDKAVFDGAAPLYSDALKASGYAGNIIYLEDRKTQQPAPARRRSRQRRITWFNPPFNKAVKSNIGQNFPRLIDKHFPRNNKLHKIFNRSTVKVSYSCMPSIGAVIKCHNARVCNSTTTPPPSGEARRCNCRVPSQCPLGGECLASGIVYQATVTTTTGTATQMHYIGATETTFKQRYANHCCSFRHESKASQTELSKYIWQLKRAGTAYEIKWTIIRRAPPYSINSKRCDLCLTEKMLLATANRSSLLNKRSELVSKCRHQNKFYLSNYDPT